MITPLRFALALFLGSLGLIPALGQYGSVDPSFNPVDDGTYGDGVMHHHSSGSEAMANVTSVVELSDGRILIAGQFRTYNGEEVSTPLGLFPDGQRDPSYNLELPSGFNASRLLLLPDEGLLVAGSMPGVGFMYPGALKRFTTDGALDDTFEVIASSTIADLTLLPDGRIVIVGLFGTVNGEAAGRVARLLPDGTSDTSFSVGGGANNQVLTVLPLADGSLLIGGTFTVVDGMPRRGLARLLEDGSVDPGFDPMAAVTSTYATVNALARDTDGRVLIGGSFVLPGASPLQNLVRILPDATLDPSFTPGTGPSSTVSTIALRPDGRLLIGGAFSTYDGQPHKALAGLLSNGQLDPSFMAEVDHAFGPHVEKITQVANGELLVGGRISAVEGRFRMGLARLSATGDLVTSFNPGRGAGGVVRGMSLMADGRIAIAGDHISYNDTPRPYLSFLTPDGELHPTFNGGSGPNAPVDLLGAMPGERLFIAGRFSAYDGVGVPRMAVVDAFGALDPTVTFPSEALPPHMVPSAALSFADGSVLLACMPSYQTYDWTSTLQRFMPDGSLDTDFNPPAPIHGGIYTMVLQPDGRILLGGSLRFGSPNAPLGIARLMPDGSVDASFSVGVGVAPADGASVNAMVVLSGGRIVVGGWFTHYNGTSARGIACIGSDGLRCPDFSTVGVTSAYFAPPGISSIMALPDGRLVLAGWFNSYGGAPHNGMAIALPDGTQDASFSCGNGPNYVSVPYIRQVLVDAQGHYLISGLFHHIDGVARHRIARLRGGGGVGVEELQTSDPQLRVWPNPAGDVLYTALPFTGSVFDVRGQLVREVSRTQAIGLGGLAPGSYMLRHADGTATRFVKQ